MTQLAEDSFWMVARAPTEGQEWGNPRRRHKTKARAEREARRLVAKTGARFFVLGVVAVIEPAAAKVAPAAAEQVAA